MTINIDDFNYHVADFSSDDINFIQSIIEKTIKKYPDVEKYIKKVFRDNQISFNYLKDNNLMVQIFAAFLHSLKDNQTITNEDQLIKIIKGYLRNYLEPIFANRKYFISSHPVQYEPKVVSILALSNYVNRDLSIAIDREIQPEADPTFDFYRIEEFINAFRVLKSSMVLFTIGDDVHAIGLYRGFMEIISKIILSEKYPEEYFKFKNYNLYLQMHVNDGTPLPQEMIDDLGSNCKNENYLAYSWAKNTHGKRISTLTELVSTARPNDTTVKQFLHLSGEFIHEDYVGVGYDYISLRKAYIEEYFLISKEIIKFGKDLIKKPQIIHLFRNIVE